MGGEQREVRAAAVEGVELAEGFDDGGAVTEEAERGFGGEGEFGDVGEHPGGVGDEERFRAIAVAAEETVLAEGVAGQRDGEEGAVVQKIVGFGEGREIGRGDAGAVFDGARGERGGKEFGEKGVAGLLVGREGAELGETFAGMIEGDGGQGAEAADMVGMEVGDDDGGKAVGGERVRGEGEGQEAAVEAGGEAARVGEVGAVAGVE